MIDDLSLFKPGIDDDSTRKKKRREREREKRRNLVEKCSTIHNRCLILFVLVTYVYDEINSVTRLNHLSFSSQNSNHRDNPR